MCHGSRDLMNADWSRIQVWRVSTVQLPDWGALPVEEETDDDEPSERRRTADEALTSASGLVAELEGENGGRVLVPVHDEADPVLVLGDDRGLGVKEVVVRRLVRPLHEGRHCERKREESKGSNGLRRQDTREGETRRRSH